MRSLITGECYRAKRPGVKDARGVRFLCYMFFDMVFEMILDMLFDVLSDLRARVFVRVLA